MRILNSLKQIVRSESVDSIAGVWRHLCWQGRRALGAFPCELAISSSRMIAVEADGVGALVNAMGMYDVHNMSLLKAVLERRPATFVDVGANVGPYTLIASEVSTALVVSFEPHPATFAILTKNVELNGRNNVRCSNLALSNHDGQVILTDKPCAPTNRVVDYPESVKACISVPCRTLDNLCEELDIFPDVVKIDVEGHEIHVIEGFEKNIQRATLLFIEGGERSEVRSAMEEHGFLGPLYFHYGVQLLLPSPQRRAEDPVYLRRSCVGDFPFLRARPR